MAGPISPPTGGGGGSGGMFGGMGATSAQMQFMDLWFQAAGELAATRAERTARNNLDKATFFARSMRRINALQSRRAFLSSSREAIAGALTEGALSQGLDSSAVQGTVASLRTQTQKSLSEQAELFQFNERKLRAEDRARRHAEAGAALRKMGQDAI